MEDFVEGQVLVRFNAPILPKAQSLLAKVRDQVIGRLNGGWLLIDTTGDSAKDTISKWRDDLGPHAIVAQPNYICRTVPSERRLVPKEAELVEPGHYLEPFLESIGAPEAWSKGHTGSRDVIVAVLDTGIAWKNQRLGKNHFKNLAELGGAPNADDDLNNYEDDVYGVDVQTKQGPTDPSDVSGHGTACAGLIGADGSNEYAMYGVNQQVSVMAVKCFDQDETSTIFTMARGYDYVIAMKKRGHNVRVISNSWSGGGPKDRCFAERINQAGELGILSVFAAGAASAKRNIDGDANTIYPPAFRLPSMLTVAACSKKGLLFEYSPLGPKTVHIAAPGIEVPSLSTSPDSILYLTGTSPAAAIAAGAAALLASVYPDLSAEGLKALLIKKAKKVSSLEGRVMSGGMIYVGDLAT